jgi:hypothetical protein
MEFTLCHLFGTYNLEGVPNLRKILTVLIFPSSETFVSREEGNLWKRVLTHGQRLVLIGRNQDEGRLKWRNLYKIIAFRKQQGCLLSRQLQFPLLV